MARPDTLRPHWKYNVKQAGSPEQALAVGRERVHGVFVQFTAPVAPAPGRRVLRIHLTGDAEAGLSNVAGGVKE